MKYFPKLRGERIYLSPMNALDAEIMTKWINDMHISDRLDNSDQLFSVAREREWLEKAEKEGYMFSVVKAEADELLGSISLFDIRHTHRNAQCGLMIGEAAERGRGYGAEALRLLLGYAFHTLNLNNVMLKVFAFNENAVACYKKAGFREIGRRRAACFCGGAYHDEIFMDILAGEFKA